MRNTPPKPRRIRSAHESKSAAVRAAAAAPSRRQQSKWQREQHQQRTLYIAIGVLAVLVLAIFGGGIFFDNVVRANAVVAQVGPDSITATQLLNEVRPGQNGVRGLDGRAKELGSGGGANGASIAQYVDQQKRSLPDQTLNAMIDERLVEQEAARRGISIAPSDVDDKERQTVAEIQAASNPTPIPEASPTAEGATPEATIVPTPEAAVSPSPLTSPTPVPTLEGSTYGPALQQLLDRNYLTEPEFRDRLQQSMVREKLTTAIGQEQFPDTQEQVHAREMVLPTPEQAASALGQLQAGADFAQLAQQISTDAATKDKGGDLGWFAKGSLADKAVEDAAFALQPGQLSDVVQGANGYALIQVAERDPARAVPANQLLSQRQKAFSDWLDARRTSQDVKLQLDQSQRDWILARIGVRP